MATFLVVRKVPGLTRDQYAAAQEAASKEAREASSRGRTISLLGGFFIPGGGRAICIFTAESLEDVTTVNERAGVPFAEVLEALELRPVEET